MKSFLLLLVEYRLIPDELQTRPAVAANFRLESNADVKHKYTTKWLNDKYMIYLTINLLSLSCPNVMFPWMESEYYVQ